MLDTYGTRPLSWYADQTPEDDEEEIVRCPCCGDKLQRTEDEGLMCLKDCYNSEFALWENIQRKTL